MPPLAPTHSGYGYRPASADRPAVSIITPYYNTGALFMETVESLLRQSLQQWEWIIVNDGSDDEAALRALLPLRHADSRIRVLDQPCNRGPSAARNAGVAASSAPLLFFLDSDDLLAPTALEQLAWTLVSHPQSAFATSWAVGFGRENLTWPLGFDTRHAFLYQNMATVMVMVRRQVFDQVGGFDEARRQGLEDYEFWLRCAANGFWGHDVHQYLIWVRRKTAEAYTFYRWEFNENPQALVSFRREMHARYPQLFRDGLPHVGGDGALVDAHALINTELPFENRLLRLHGQRRVLVLMPWMRMGGADRFVLDLATRLTARGDRVSVCLLRDEVHTWLDELRRATSDVFDLGAFLAPADYPRFLHYLIESREITTVLISNSLLAYQLLPYLRAHCPQTAFVDYLHMEEPRWRSGGVARAGIEHEALLDLHIVSSQYLRRWMIERNADPQRIAVCTTNIDPREWQPTPALRAELRARLGISAEQPVILFAGRLVPQKRPLLAAEVLRRLHLSGTPFVCLVAGEGEDAGRLRRFIRRHRLSRHVRLLGALPPGQLYALMAASDLLLLPSDYEGIALTLYEAMAMGVVPVAADVCGQRELVTPECGVLLPHGPDEAQQYVDALRRLIANPALRAQMARAGRARIERHFTADQLTDCMQMLFQQAEERVTTAPRPAISPGVGLATATLAIEHHQLERRLRALPPVRAALALRRSSAWHWLDRLRGLRGALDKSDRTIYVARREIMQRLRRIHKRVTGGA